MLSFIYNNKSILLIIGVLIIVIGLYFTIKSMPTKVKKKEKKEPEKNKVETKSEEVVKEPEIIPEAQEKTQNDDKKSKKEDKKPKIVQVFKRQERESGDNKEQKIDPIYDRNVEFVNTSKNIAKFKSFKEEESLETQADEEFGFVTETQEDCEFCDDKVKHFDHSKRMSSFAKEENVDDMFASHISDKYLNINSDRHLNLDEKFHNKLFEMTERMMNNSEGKITASEEGFDFGNSNDDEIEIEDDEVKINMKTALIADTYFNRKKKK